MRISEDRQFVGDLETNSLVQWSSSSRRNKVAAVRSVSLGSRSRGYVRRPGLQEFLSNATALALRVNAQIIEIYAVSAESLLQP
jgi:hypothetical protein